MLDNITDANKEMLFILSTCAPRRIATSVSFLYKRAECAKKFQTYTQNPDIKKPGKPTDLPGFFHSLTTMRRLRSE